jgi:hypothetical protein
MTAINDTDDGGKEPVWSSEESTPYKLSTGSNGKTMLPKLDSGTLYKMAELTAPTEYIKASLPFYFAENSTPSNLPADVVSSDIKLLTKSGSLTIPNNKMLATSVNALKYWHDPPGFTGTHNEVEVELFQSKTDPSGKTDGPEISFTFSDNQGNIDTRTFNVKYGDNLQIGLRSIAGYFDQGRGGTIKLNDETVNIYNNNLTGFSWSNPVWNYCGEYQENWETNSSIYCEYFLTYTNVTENMAWEVYFDDAKTFTEYAVFIDNQEVGVPITAIPDDAVSVGTGTLNSENDWTYTWNNIPETDEFGYKYYYYAKENTVVATYTPSYNNNGINSGTIYITNRGEGYTNEMPATGGIGRKPFFIIGFILLSGSSLIYLSGKRHRKLKKHP